MKKYLFLVALTFSVLSFSQSINFSGSRSYLKMLSNPSFAIASGEDYTIEWYQKLDPTSYKYFRLFSFGNHSITEENWQGLQGDSAYMYYNTNFGNKPAGGITGYSNTWMHVAIVRNSGTIQVYVNGRATAVNIVYNGVISGGDFYLGALAGGENYKGKITHFRFTKSALYSRNFVPESNGLSAGNSLIFIDAGTDNTSMLNNQGSIGGVFTQSGANYDSETPFPFTVPFPTLTVTGSIDPFVSCYNQQSEPQFFTLSGSLLQADVSITAPTGFLVSTNQSTGYSSSITLQRSSNSLSSTNVYVVMAARTANPTSSNISISTTGATTETILVSGSVGTSTPPTILQQSTGGYGGGNGSSTTRGSGGGGGGATGNGVNGRQNVGGAGGTGYTSTITGSAVIYGAGGAGARGDSNTVGADGAANTGNGGNAGGATSSSSRGGGNGGSGIVILKYSNGNSNPTIQSFGTVGSTTWTAPVGVTSVEYLVVGGGGGGGNGYDTGGGGGGSAGVVLSGTMSVTSSNSYNVVVGSGGNGGENTRANSDGQDGGLSQFDTVISLGGPKGLGSRSTASNTKIGVGGLGGIIQVANPQIEYCLGDTADIIQARGLTGYSLRWYTSPTGGTASTVEPVPSTANVGLTTYYVSQVNSIGCESERASISINVSIPSITGNAQVKVGNTLQLTGSGTAAASTPWTSSDTNVLTVSNSGLVTAVATGTATVTYTNNGGCSTTAVVSVYDFNATIDQTQVCSGEDVVLTLSINDGSVQWQSSTDGATGWANISGATTNPFTVENITSTTYFRGLYTNTGFQDAYSNTVSATIPAGPGFNSGNALDFVNTNSDIVKTSSNISALNIRGDITLEMWVNIDQLPSDWVRLIGKGGRSDRTYGFWLATNGSLLFQMYGPQGGQIQTSDRLITGQWYHISATRSGSAIKIYINGVESASGTYSGTPYSSNEPLQLGYGNVHTYFNGKMDEVRVWNTGRTATQIADNSQVDVTGQVGLVVYYRMNEGSGSTLNNSSASSIPATIVGPDWVSSFSSSVEIVGSSVGCVGIDQTLSHSISGGAWTSSDTSVLTVNSSGVVSHVAPGTANVTYSYTYNSCSYVDTILITVGPTPVISGLDEVIVGETIALTGSGIAASSNPWVSSDTSVLTVNASGVVIGVGEGTATVTYTNNTGCTATLAITVELGISTITAVSNPIANVGTTVTITGTNFANVSAVQIGTATTTFTIVSPTSITATIPSGVFSGTIQVTTPNGQYTGGSVVVNYGPTAVALSQSSIVESAASGAVVGTFSATDANGANDTYTYALVSGTGSADNASFTIVGNSIRTASALDFETKSSYSIRVRVTDQGGLTFEQVFTVVVLEDTDADGVPDDTDPDIDGDGILNDADADVDGDGVVENGPDFDGDGINDANDPDIDGDGVLNADDPNNYNTDTDGDGIPDGADADIDGDGVLNPGVVDTDGDGIPDYADADSDGDGVIDSGKVDTDGDGIVDVYDPMDNNADDDGDGIPNGQDADVDGDGVVDNGLDTDGDGVNNSNDSDIDGDGILNDADADVDGDGTVDNGPDTDGDGTNDANDPDIDGDGILNAADADADGDGVVENGPDFDGDGTNDANDADIDGDGLPNAQDPDDFNSDSDGDGIPDAADADVDGDGTTDGGVVDTDGDGIPDSADTDANGDGVIDSGKVDTDGDGIVDAFDSLDNNADDDGDGIPNGQDADVDGDGVVDNGLDTDGDGVNNANDPDMDGDGQTNEHEIACGSNPLLASSKALDTDGDNIPNCVDNDDDGDGVLDSEEAVCGSDPLDADDTPIDTDRDGNPDCIDSDDDGDGILDAQDAFPLDGTEWVDADGDGIGNNADTDDDNDGFSDSDEIAAGTDPLDATDVPADGDGDGIPDALDNDFDNDGITNDKDAFPLDATETMDTDGDGIGDNADMDDDNDGISDSDEIASGTNPKNASSAPRDQDGDGIPDALDADIDGDGVANAQDAFPYDRTESVDTDGDGLGNNLDPDDDNDGVLDVNDANPLSASSSKDTDGDGVADEQDKDVDNDGFADEIREVSGVLTPGSGGVESLWVVPNIKQFPYSRVSIMDRNGNEVFSAVNYQNDWDGTYKDTGKRVPAGPYLYRITLGDGTETKSGWIYIVY